VIGPRIAAAVLLLGGGTALRLATDGIGTGLGAAILLPAVLAVALWAGWLPAVGLVAAGLLAWSAEATTLLAFALAAGVQIAIAETMRRRLRAALTQASRLSARLAAEQDLLREMHHRIANALQFLASLLSLQAGAVTAAAQARDALHDAAARLGTVAKVHRRLNDPALSGAVLGATLQELAADLLASRGLEPRAEGGVRIDVSIAEAGRDLDAARATSVAMIVAEAATNAAKHAFAASGRGCLRITLDRRGPDFVLAIADDGPGPPGTAPPPDSLGLTVMEAMARRLDGGFRIAPGAEGGAEVTVTFPADVVDHRTATS
jgi:two-component system, sensor histidine kinase PdtaS